MGLALWDTSALWEHRIRWDVRLGAIATRRELGTARHVLLGLSVERMRAHLWRRRVLRDPSVLRTRLWVARTCVRRARLTEHWAEAVLRNVLLALQVSSALDRVLLSHLGTVVLVSSALEGQLVRRLMARVGLAVLVLPVNTALRDQLARRCAMEGSSVGESDCRLLAVHVMPVSSVFAGPRHPLPQMAILTALVTVCEKTESHVVPATSAPPGTSAPAIHRCLQRVPPEPSSPPSEPHP